MAGCKLDVDLRRPAASSITGSADLDQIFGKGCESRTYIKSCSEVEFSLP